MNKTGNGPPRLEPRPSYCCKLGSSVVVKTTLKKSVIIGFDLKVDNCFSLSSTVSRTGDLLLVGTGTEVGIWIDDSSLDLALPRALPKVILRLLVG